MAIIREKREVVQHLAATLVTKPFVILAGISGSGKTQLARNLAAGIAAGAWHPEGYQRRMSATDGARLVDRLNHLLVSSGVVPHLLDGDDPQETLDVYPLPNPSQRGLIGDELAAATGSYSDVIHNRVAFLPVRPDWQDARQLWGTYNPLTGLFYPSVALRVVVHAFIEFIAFGEDAGRHVLILDEMNLSRVEYYLSDLLSLMEASASLTDDNRRRLGELVHVHPYTRPLWTLSPPRYLGEPATASEQLFKGKLDRSWALAMAYLTSGSGNMVVDAVDVDFDEVIDGASWHRLVPPKICLPPNITIVGTVDVDETTFAFSPKVLDRAFVVEFDEMNYDDVCGGWPGYRSIAADMNRLYEILEPARMHFGYRVIHEFLQFLEASGGSWARDGDFLLSAKVLPKLRGTEERLGPTLERLLGYCLGIGLDQVELATRAAATHTFDQVLDRLDLSRAEVPYPKSARRVLQLLVELEQTGVASFM